MQAREVHGQLAGAERARKWGQQQGDSIGGRQQEQGAEERSAGEEVGSGAAARPSQARVRRKEAKPERQKLLWG